MMKMFRDDGVKRKNRLIERIISNLTSYCNDVCISTHTL